MAQLIVTSCLNRRAFTAMVDRYLDRIANKEAGHSGALLVIDVDHFKAINDRFGHICGDEALKASPGRSGGRCPSSTSSAASEMRNSAFSCPASAPTAPVADRIRTEVFATELDLGEASCRASISVGGVTFDRDTSFSELYRHADQRLYEAKRNGRNRVEIFHHASPAASGALVSVH